VTTDTPAAAVSLPAGTRSRITVVVAVIAAAVVVWSAQRSSPWLGDPSQLRILALVNLVTACAAGWYFIARSRTMVSAEDRRLALVFLPVAAHFALRLLLWAFDVEAQLVAPLERVSWAATQLAAAALLAAAVDVPATGCRIFPSVRVITLASMVAAVMVGLQRLGAAQGLRPEQIGLCAAFLLCARAPLRNPRQRWLETALAGYALLTALTHATLSWSELSFDGPFMWAHALLPLAVALPVLGSARDDAEHLKSSTTLSDRIKVQRQRTEVFLDSLPVLVLSVDREHRLRYANRIAGELLRIPRGVSDPNLGPTWMAHVHPPDRERLFGAIPEVADSESLGWEAVLRIVDGEGGVHWLNTQLHPVVDPQTGETLVEVVASDVTDLFLARRTAEARQTKMTFLSNVAQTVAGEVADLRILERFLELGVEIYPMVSVLLYRPMPDGSRLRLEGGIGPGAERFHGDRHQPVGPGHPCGLTFRDGFPRSAAAGEAVSAEVARQIAEEHGITHLLYLPLLAAGRVVGVLATTTTSEPSLAVEEVDLLTQVGFLIGGAVYLSQLIRELDEQRAVAMEASRLKSEFLANTSHELRTPLTAILGFLRLIIDGAVEEKEKRREFLEIAYESAEKLLNIINDVLDLAKIEAGRLEVHHAPVPVRKVLGDIEALFRHQMKSQGLEFAIASPTDGLVLWADPDRTVQVLTNLLSNALKFTPRGGSVSIDCRAVGDEVEFTVQDTGIGIPANEIDRIFDSFYQIDGSTTRQHGGTGLGLTISRRLAELMGGTLELESAGENLGTTARLHLLEYDPESPSIDA
jgi:signal transduction histidine kinase/PAS domain-containing protein